MEDIKIHDSTTKKAKSNRKITFNEIPEYFTTMPYRRQLRYVFKPVLPYLVILFFNKP